MNRHVAKDLRKTAHQFAIGLNLNPPQTSFIEERAYKILKREHKKGIAVDDVIKKLKDQI